MGHAGEGATGEELARACEDRTMQESQIHVYARELWKAQGPKAIAEAAHKATEFEKKSDREQADQWRRIEAILMQIRGPHQA
jgi:hypothetical protein